MKGTVIQIVLVSLERFPKNWKEDWNSWKSEEESRPSKTNIVKIGQNIEKVVETWIDLLSQWKKHKE